MKKNLITSSPHHLITSSPHGIWFKYCLLLFVLFIIQSCSKENPPIDIPSSNEITSERDIRPYNEVFSFYLNGNAITESQFMAADTNYIRHFIINVQGTIVDHKCLLFSSNNLYESWGDSIGSNISTMNRVEELLYHIADSANLPALSEIYPDTVFAWYDSLSRKIMLDEDLISESPAAFCFTGGHLNQAMCNPIPPSFPSGVPGSCAGVSDVFTIFYLPGGKPVLPFMNNKASAWIPQKSIFCTGSYTQAHFRGYDKAFFFNRIGTININISVFTPWHYVPFSGVYSMYNNKVSSFAHWQDL